MLQRTFVRHRTLSKWRHLLHPLSPHARRDQWFKRDLTERNEQILRRPYYVLRPATAADLPPPRNGEISSNDAGSDEQHPVSSPSVIGPQPPGLETAFIRKTQGLRPNYPEAWDIIPPHDPSREGAK